MDSFGPSKTMSLGGNYYGLVVVDDYSRFTLTLFIATKMKLIMLLRDLLKLSKMREIVAFPPLNQTMGVSSKMKGFTNFAANLESNTTFQHQGLHNKMN